MKKYAAFLIALLILIFAVVSCESSDTHTGEGSSSAQAVISGNSTENPGIATQPEQTAPETTAHVHSFGTVWETDADSHWYSCSCGEKSQFAAHSSATEWQTDDANHWRVCECGVKTDFAAHTYGEWIVSQEPTCLESGSRYQVCSVCGKSVSEVIPAKGHTAVTDPARAATCKAYGLTEGSHCSVCNAVLKAQQTVNALGHDYVFSVCSRCGEKEYFDCLITMYDALNAEKIVKDNRDKDGNIIPLAGYRYDGNGFHTVSPTYTSGPFAQFGANRSFDLTRKNDSVGNHVFSVTFTVDSFAYMGGSTDGVDEWICFSITDKQAATPGAPKYQDGLFILCRGKGDGSVQFQPFFDVGGTFDNNLGAFATKNIPVNAEGKEVYTFYIDYAEGKWTVSVKLADGTVFPIGLNLNGIFEGFKENAYFQITAQTGYVDKTDASKNNIAFTVNYYNGIVPAGSDSKNAVSAK